MATFNVRDVSIADFQNLCHRIRQYPHCPNCGEIIRPELTPSDPITCIKCNQSITRQEIQDTQGRLSFAKLMELSRLQVPWATMARWGDIRFDPAKFIPRENPQKYFERFRTSSNSRDRCLFVLLGETGYGKTWLAANWAFNLVMRKQLVFFCDLREGIDQFLKIVLGCKKEDFQLTLDNIAGKIPKSFVWILDGYDDCPTETDSAFIFEKILRNNQKSINVQPLHLVVLTSRPRDWSTDIVRFASESRIASVLWHDLKEVPFSASAVLSPFTYKEITLAADKYHLPPPTMWSGALRNLAQNPLWISFASELYRPRKILPDVVDPQFYLKFFARLSLQPTDLEALGDFSLYILNKSVNELSRGSESWMQKIPRSEIPQIDFITISKLSSVGLLALYEGQSGMEISLTNHNHALFSIAYRIYQLSKTEREDQLVSIYTNLVQVKDKESILHIAWALSVEIPEAPGIEDIPMVNYNGIALRVSDQQAMVALEKLVGKPIPYLERVSWNTFGFSASNGHIIALNLSNRGLSSLPPMIGNLQSLQYLWLSENKISELPPSFGNLSSLKKFEIISNELVALPDSICNLRTIEKISLTNNQISALPDDIGQLEMLERLSIAGNRLKRLPKSIGKLGKLKEFTINHNYLTELPEEIGNLLLLEYCDLSQNSLKKLPETNGDLQTLKELYLGHNLLSELPESIGNLQLLQKLDLSFNQIERLPTSFGDLELLEILDLKDNKLKELPAFIGNLEMLKILNLNNNSLETLPDSMKKLVLLQSLYLQNNRLTVLPSSLGNLECLLELDLTSNRLSTLPESTGQLHELKVLMLSHNQITLLPSCICNLNSLLFLYLEGNKITELPRDLAHLVSLQYLNLRSNLLTALPPFQNSMKLLTEGNPL